MSTTAVRPASEGLALATLGLGCFFAVVVFLPAEGRIAGPLHEGIGVLLGHSSFLLPLGLLAAGVLLLAPGLVHVWRLVGIALLTVAGLPACALLGVGTGLIGEWLSSSLLEWLGGPLTVVVLLGLLVAGCWLAFDLSLAQMGGGLTRVGRCAVAMQGRVHPPAVRAFRAWIPPRALPPVALQPRPGPVAATQTQTQTPSGIGAQPASDGAPGAPLTGAAADWGLPSPELLRARSAEEVSEADLTARAQVIEDTLASFNVEAEVVEVNHGPTVTQFGVEPAPGVAVSKILSRQNDLALRLGASPIRLEAPVPGKSVVGVEVPNAAVATVTLRDVLASADWDRVGGLRLALGRDVSGKAVVGDLARMPHLLIAGATGAGKSVCVNAIVASLLFQFTPEHLQMLMIDPKRVELVGFGDLPHLRLPVITDMEQVVGALKWAVLEMDRRYKLFAQDGVRNLEAYNKRSSARSGLPYLVLIIDELADMMMTAADEVEKTLCRLAQLGRAAGVHLVVATQRPSVDVLTGLIKANFPTRVAFAVSSQTDSRVILDQAGAERLLGRGDALFLPPDAMKPIRLQGAFVSDDEMRDLVEHWKAQGGPRYTPEDLDQVAALGRADEEDDDVYERACELAETVGRVSTSLLARRLGIGQDRAERLLARLIEEGVAEE